MKGKNKPRTGKALALVLLSILVISCLPAFPSTGQVPNPTHEARLSLDLEAPLAKLGPDDAIRLIVHFKSQPTAHDRAWLAGAGFSIHRTFTALPIHSVSGNVADIQKLLDNPGIAYIEHNDPVVADMEIGTNAINATHVWSRLVRENGVAGNPITGEGVTVCVVDTGIDAGHPDLDYGTKTVYNVYDAGNGNWIEAENTDTNYGHGTHVAGTVAGNGDASAGARRGVAPGANLCGVTVSIPEEVTNPLEDGYIQGLEWVYDHSRPDANPHNIRVVTNSWHSTVTEYDPQSALTQMIEKLTFENNVVSTWSSGNDGRDDPEGNELTTSGQGNTPVAIMVAAYERDGSAVTDFSSRGRVGANHTYPDIGAPGRTIWSTSARRTVISAGTYTGSNRNPYYLAISGTSMSTPHVAGLAALLWQAAPSLGMSQLHEDYSGESPDEWYGNPNTRIHEMEWLMEASAKYLAPTEANGNIAGDNMTGWDGRPMDYVQGYGIVDADRAVGMALTLQKLREKYPDGNITVWDALAAYERMMIWEDTEVATDALIAGWEGEFSRYNDMLGISLSDVNQTKYLWVPPNAASVEATLNFNTLDMESGSYGDLTITVDFNGDGSVDFTGASALGSNGLVVSNIPVPSGFSGGTWTFDIEGITVKMPRPLRDNVHYVEARTKYTLDIRIILEGEGNINQTFHSAMGATLYPTADGGTARLVRMSYYDLDLIELDRKEEKLPAEQGFPFWALGAILLLALVAAYIARKKRIGMRREIPFSETPRAAEGETDA